MEKKIILGLFVAVIVAISGYNVCLSKSKTQLLDIVMSNFEALANDSESGGGYNVFTSQCPPPIQYKTAVSCQAGGRDDCYPSDC